MLSNGNYAQYFPQGLNPQLMGTFAGGAPQLGPQGVFGQSVFGVPGAYGGNSGYGLDSGSGAGQHIVFALGQLAQHVATQGALAQQIGASLGQLVQQLAYQIVQQGRQATFPSIYGGSPFSGFGNQAGLGNSVFDAGLGQSLPFNTGTSGGLGGYGFTPQGFTPQGFAPQGFTPQGFTPQAQMWGIPRPAMAS